jgi:exodeoxyribonuclease VII small subunit
METPNRAKGASAAAPDRKVDSMSASKPSAKFADIKDLPFERALKELEQIVGRLERGDVELEESITIYERGEALKDHCDRLLKAAEAKVERLTFGQDGQPKGTQPLDPEN